MNKDRRAVAGVLADITRVYTRQRSIPPKVLIIIRDAVKALEDTEQRSIKKMEGYKDSESTAVNYRNAVSAHEDLMTAREALEEHELDEALPLLVRVAEATSPVPEAPAKKTRRSK